MCFFGLMAAICLFWWRYFKRRAQASEGAMRINELQCATTQSVKLNELILLRERPRDNMRRVADWYIIVAKKRNRLFLDEVLNNWSSTVYVPSYEEVTTKDDVDIIDATTHAQCTAPPCYTNEEREADLNPYPPSYENIRLRTSNK